MALQRFSKIKEISVTTLNYIVFGVCDLTDRLLCPVFRILDSKLDMNATPCHCRQPGAAAPARRSQVYGEGHTLDFWTGPCHTLYERGKKWSRSQKNLEESKIVKDFTIVCAPGYIAKWKAKCRASASASSDVPSQEFARRNPAQATSWSDCGCETCTAWLSKEKVLHVHVDCEEFCIGNGEGGSSEAAVHNVLFIHGFLSSSNFWIDTVLPCLSKEIRASYRLFAVDVLGFGKSPRPDDCLYTNADHVEMIQRSVLRRYGIQRFHVVGHSMGCTIALALAGQEAAAVQSITILAPLYFATRPGVPPASYVLSNVAPQKVWPFFAFMHAIMSWYEHLGRLVCFVFCKHHRIWIPVMAFVSRNLGSRMPYSFLHDYMQHSHKSAFKMFHNTICAGPFVMEHSMKQLDKAGRRVHVIHGEDDATCSIECGVALSRRFNNVTLSRIPGAGHMTIVLGREQELAQELETQIIGYYD